MHYAVFLERYQSIPYRVLGELVEAQRIIYELKKKRRSSYYLELDEELLRFYWCSYPKGHHEIFDFSREKLQLDYPIG